jgi:hypothetical protein
MSSVLWAVGLTVAGDLLTPRHATPSEVERSNLDTLARLRAVPVETLPRAVPHFTEVLAGAQYR